MAARTTNPNDLPTAEHPAVPRMRPKWQRSRIVRGGTDSFRAEKATLLPRYSAEDMIDWDARVSLTVVIDFLNQAIEGLVGLGLRHDPELGANVPEQLADYWEDLDGEGNHGTVVLAQTLDQAIQDGHHVLFTDHPVVDRKMRLDEERALNLRPYVRRIGVDQIKSWRTIVVGGRRILGQFVFTETVDVPTGVFGSSSVTRYRVYRQRFRAMGRGKDAPIDLKRPYVEWEVWEEQQHGAVTTVERTSSGTIRKGPTQIPIAIAYGGKRGKVLESEPVLDGLAHANIRWGQVASDLANTLHLAGIPIPVIIGKLLEELDENGKPKSDLRISTSKPLEIDAGGDFKFVSASGESLASSRAELQDWETRMGAMALSIIQPTSRTTETATESNRQRAKEQSKLQRSLRSLEDAAEQTLIYMAQYAGLPTEGCEITIRRDFDDILSIEHLRLLSDLADRRQLTLRRFLREIKRAGAVGTDFEVDEEVDALERQEHDAPEGPDPETLSDDELAARVVELEAIIAKRKQRVAEGQSAKAA